MVVLWNAGYIISSMHNIDPALAEKAVGYLRALLWGAPAISSSRSHVTSVKALRKPNRGW
jgi:Na+-driven multidrug efflux pump